MSVTTGISHMEIGFALGALVLTVIAGFVLLPVLRKALREGAEDQAKAGDSKGEF